MADYSRAKYEYDRIVANEEYEKKLAEASKAAKAELDKYIEQYKRILKGQNMTVPDDKTGAAAKQGYYFKVAFKDGNFLNLDANSYRYSNDDGMYDFKKGDRIVASVNVSEIKYVRVIDE